MLSKSSRSSTSSTSSMASIFFTVPWCVGDCGDCCYFICSVPDFVFLLTISLICSSPSSLALNRFLIPFNSAILQVLAVLAYHPTNYCAAKPFCLARVMHNRFIACTLSNQSSSGLKLASLLRPSCARMLRFWDTGKADLAMVNVLDDIGFL